MNHGGRPRTGGLVRKGALWYARLTIIVDGAPMRTTRSLGTDSKQIARAKLKRLLSEDLKPEQAARGETFEEAARRYMENQQEEAEASHKRELARFEQHIFPVIGPMRPKDIHPRHVNELLEGVRVKNRVTGRQVMPSHGTLRHVLNCISVVLDDLQRKEIVDGNVARLAKLPKRKREVKERAVLTDFELARYLKWQHPDAKNEKGPGLGQIGLLERQTMSCIARLFGGVRTGDLHVLDWSSLDTANGRFEWGYAPRAKTRSPQRLGVDEMLRPILRRWWEHSGRPRKGLVFPSLRDGSISKAGKGEKHEVSHADAFRRDLRRAFGIDKLEPIVTKQKNGRHMPGYKWLPCRKLTAREVELLEGNGHILRVDFHSWRRAYCQSLADAGVNAQLAKALAGHATEAAHERYVRNSEKARELPEAARPQIDLGKVATSRRQR